MGASPLPPPFLPSRTHYQNGVNHGLQTEAAIFPPEDARRKIRLPLQAPDRRSTCENQTGCRAWIQASARRKFEDFDSAYGERLRAACALMLQDEELRLELDLAIKAACELAFKATDPQHFPFRQ